MNLLKNVFNSCQIFLVTGVRGVVAGVVVRRRGESEMELLVRDFRERI